MGSGTPDPELIGKRLRGPDQLVECLPTGTQRGEPGVRLTDRVEKLVDVGRGSSNGTRALGLRVRLGAGLVRRAPAPGVVTHGLGSCRLCTASWSTGTRCPYRIARCPLRWVFVPGPGSLSGATELVP